MRAQSLGGSPPLSVSIFIGASGWPERLGSAYHCLRRRSARGGGVRGWLSATRHPQFGMRPFWDRAGAEVGTSVQLIRGFLKSSRLCVWFFYNFFRFHSKSDDLRRRGKVRPGRDPRRPGKAIVRTGVAMSLSTQFETGLVFDPGPQPG